MSSIELGRNVDEDVKEELRTFKSGEGDLGLGTCRRAKGAMIWLVVIL